MENLFPSLRADNFSSGGVWDYAHSTILEIAVEMGIPVAVMIVLCGTGFAVYPRSRHGQIQGPKSAFAGCNHRDCVCIRQSIFPCRFPAILSYSVFCSVAGSPEHPLRRRRPAKCDRKRLLRLSGQISTLRGSCSMVAKGSSPEAWRTAPHGIASWFGGSNRTG